MKDEIITALLLTFIVMVGHVLASLVLDFFRFIWG